MRSYVVNAYENLYSAYNGSKSVQYINTLKLKTTNNDIYKQRSLKYK